MYGILFATTVGWIVYQCYKDAIKDDIRAWRAYRKSGKKSGRSRLEHL